MNWHESSGAPTMAGPGADVRRRDYRSQACSARGVESCGGPTATVSTDGRNSRLLTEMGAGEGEAWGGNGNREVLTWV